ncbi:MAG: DUF6122 family protein [Hyphomicrobiales bacterium]
MISHECLSILQTIVHYSLHLLVPAIIAYIFFRKIWKKAYIILLCTMLVDLDHLFATPMFEAGRCSIGFHPLHSFYAIGAYFILLFFPKTRIFGVGLLFHMFTDWQDCLWMNI